MVSRLLAFNPGFCNMMRPGVFLLPSPGQDASPPLAIFLQHFAKCPNSALLRIFTSVWREALRE